MNYSLKDYQGNEITVSPDQASKMAGIAELIEIEVNGQTHYINPKNIASIKPIPSQPDLTTKQIQRGDARNDPEMYAKSREKIKGIRRELFKNVK